MLLENFSLEPKSKQNLDLKKSKNDQNRFLTENSKKLSQNFNLLKIRLVWTPQTESTTRTRKRKRKRAQHSAADRYSNSKSNSKRRNISHRVNEPKSLLC